MMFYQMANRQGRDKQFGFTTALQYSSAQDTQVATRAGTGLILQFLDQIPSMVIQYRY